jgi:hypothetical protein
MLTKKAPKSTKNFICENCDFKCSKPNEWIRHIATQKHKNSDSLTKKEFSLTKKDPFFPTHICGNCNKEYGSRVGLWYHEKKCLPIKEQNNIIVEHEPNLNHMSLLTNLVLEVVKNNSELQKQSSDLQKQFMECQKNNVDLQKQVLDVCKNIQPSFNNCNNNNNTFNMQVFLNEECKDAMNISEFVNSVNIQLEDLENVGRLGYAAGMSNIIVKELKMLDVYKRPIHCSDIKRETFYIKDNDVWEKETPENNKMKKAIKGISQKNMIKLNDWRDKHPDCLDSSSEYNDIYLKLMVEACGGRGDFSVGENKILKNIAKEVVIKK